MPGTRYPSAEEHPPSPPSKGGKSVAKGGCHPFKGGMQCSQPSAFSIQRAVLGLGPRAMSRRSSERGERKSGCPKRSELPDFPTCERREGV